MDRECRSCIDAKERPHKHQPPHGPFQPEPYPETPSDIGLPDNLSRDDAYIAGVADGEANVFKLLRKHIFTIRKDEIFCDCGWESIPSPLFNIYEQYFRHIEKEEF